jgi:hypothetical protein
MPLEQKKALEIVRRLRRDTIRILKIPKKITRLDEGRDVAIEICRWLVEEAIVEKWRGFPTSEDVVFVTKIDGKAYYLVTSKVLSQEIRDKKERLNALRFLQADGGLEIEKGRRF